MIMSSFGLFSKSRMISLLIGLILFAIVLPGVVSAATSSPAAQYISNTIPSTMDPGQSYPVSITMKNTGNIAWDEASMVRLGALDDASGDAARFGLVRIKIPAGTSVSPGSQYTFSFTMKAPSSAGSYTPKYRMVWDGHQWFGSRISKSVTVTGSNSAVNAELVSETIPSTMNTGQSYPVSITMKNTGTTTWNEASMVRLGALDDASGDAARFGLVRIKIPAGTSVSPGSQYTFSFTMKAPSAAGSYTPKYQMVWDGHQWFGSQVSKSLQVTGIAGSTGVAPSAQFTASPVLGQYPLTVQFTDASVFSGTGLYKWDVDNDGITDYTTQNPAHTYRTPGTYTVKLMVFTAAGSYTETKTNYITVTSVPVRLLAPTSSTQPSQVTVSAGTPVAQLVSSTIPTSMNAGQSYSVSVTMKNIGSTSWTEAGLIRLGGVGDASGDAVKFGPTRIRIPAGTSVAPGSSYTFTFSMKGPASAGTYSPQYQMVWDGHQWFGPTASQSIRVAGTSSSSSGSTTSPAPESIISLSSIVSSDGTYGAGGYTGAGPIGGGAGYSSIITSGTYTVTTLAELKSHMVGGSQPATAGQVIFIPSGTTITFPAGNTPAIPPGVTLASDRGYNGHAGAVLKKSSSSGGWTDGMLDIGGDNVRVTGLQLEGEMFPSTSSPLVSESNYLQGITNNGGYTGEIVDNNELRGWAYSAVQVKEVPSAGRPWIHNNYFHHNEARGEGYGVEVNGGDALVEANIFNYNRHDITGTGVTGEKYEFRYNIIQGGCDNPIGGVHVDVHESLDSSSKAGNTFLIHHNTVIQGSGINQEAFVHIRDIPTTGAYVYNNDIQTNWGSDSNYDGAESVIYQSHSQTRTVSNWNLFATNNKWKGTVYSTNSGIVVEQCGSGSTC